MNDEQLKDELFLGLRFMRAASFPKRCPTCSRVYETAEDFLNETGRLDGGSGLKEALDEADNAVVELFRNCPCGSTLMEVFLDRRDTSDAGLMRRERFGRLLDSLEKAGLERAVARMELLKVMKGGHSEVLERYGLKTRD